MWYQLTMSLPIPTSVLWVVGAVVLLLLAIFIIRRLFRFVLFAVLALAVIAGWLLIRHGGLESITQAPWWPW